MKYIDRVVFVVSLLLCLGTLACGDDDPPNVAGNNTATNNTATNNTATNNTATNNTATNNTATNNTATNNTATNNTTTNNTTTNNTDPCPTAGEELCDGSCVDVATDVQHCGACGNPCAGGPDTVATCDGGSCAVACEDGFVDIDGDADDPDGSGCECGITNEGVEICDGIDNDCDGEIDEDADDESTWYEDSDGDGHGVDDATTEACDQPAGYVAQGGDCDDTDADIHPDADEVCDGVDNNCDTNVDPDDAVDASTWYADSDGDGYGDDNDTTTSCDQPADYIAAGGDCDDTDPAIHPDADEVCDGADNNCDGNVDPDDAVDASTWYADSDSDGYGDDTATTMACDQPAGYIALAGDCDDTDPAINPDADEVCDGADNNCDGDTDPDDSIDASTWYADSDADGHGDDSVTTTACDQPAGYIADSGDCDDGDDTVYPGAPGKCDGKDTDCNGSVDDIRLISTSPQTFTLPGTAGDGTTPPDTMAAAADDGFCVARGSGALVTRTIRFMHVDSTGNQSTHSRSFSGGGDFQILDVKWTGTSCLALARERVFGGVGGDTTYALQLFRWEPDTSTILDLRVDDDDFYPDDDPETLNAAMQIVAPDPGCSLLCLDALHIAYVQNDPSSPDTGPNRLVYRETVPDFPSTAGITAETVITSVVGNNRVTMGPSPAGDHEWLVMWWSFDIFGSDWEVHSGPTVTHRPDLTHSASNYTDPHIGSFRGTPYIALRDLNAGEVVLKEVTDAYEYRFEMTVNDDTGDAFETRSMFTDNIRQSSWQTIDNSGPFPITTTWNETGWFMQPYSDELNRVITGLAPTASGFTNSNSSAGDEFLSINTSGSYLQLLRMYSQDPLEVAIDEFTCY